MFMVHKNFKDVFIEVVKTDRGPEYRKMKIRWWNLGCVGEPFELYLGTQTITVQEKDWNDWSFFDPSVDKHPGRS